MKLFQSRATHMDGQAISVSYGAGYPSMVYPNGGGYCYHDFIEIEFFASGSGIHHLNGVPYLVEAGYFYILMPGDYHYYSLDESVPFEIYNIKLDTSVPSDEILKMLESGSHPIAAYLEGEEYETVIREMEFLNKHWLYKKSRGEDPEDALTRNCAERVILLFMQNAVSGEGSDKSAFPNEIKAIIDYVGKHFGEQITSDDMAELTGLTPHYFSSYFKKHSGVAFCDYVNRVRLFRAARLLVLTELSVKEIADASGFRSQAYFSRLFAKQFGIPPLAYRSGRR